jgi:hypothetical protein
VPFCSSVNLLPGYSQMLAFTRRSCGGVIVIKVVDSQRPPMFTLRAVEGMPV